MENNAEGTPAVFGVCRIVTPKEVLQQLYFFLIISENKNYRVIAEAFWKITEGRSYKYIFLWTLREVFDQLVVFHKEVLKIWFDLSKGNRNFWKSEGICIEIFKGSLWHSTVQKKKILNRTSCGTYWSTTWRISLGNHRGTHWEFHSYMHDKIPETLPFNSMGSLWWNHILNIKRISGNHCRISQEASEYLYLLKNWKTGLIPEKILNLYQSP